MELAIRNPTGTKLYIPSGYQQGATGVTVTSASDTDNATAIVVSTGNDAGGYYFLLEADDSKYDRKITVIYSVTVDGQDTSYSTTYDIYTPYASVDKIREVTGNTTASDAELQMMERIAVGKAEAIMGTSYTSYFFVDQINGMGADVLDLNRPILELHRLTGDDELLYYHLDSDAAEWEQDFMITSTRYRIRKRGASAEHPYPNKVGYFGYDKYYEVQGVFGHAYIPTDLSFAIATYVGDLVSGNNAAALGISQYGNDAYTVKYSDNASKGTGNTTVDTILAKYRAYNMAVV